MAKDEFPMIMFLSSSAPIEEGPNSGDGDFWSEITGLKRVSGASTNIRAFVQLLRFPGFALSYESMSVLPDNILRDFVI